MAEDRTPRVASQSGLVPCPPDDVTEERAPSDKSHARGRKRRTPGAEDRRRRSEPEIPFRTRSV